MSRSASIAVAVGLVLTLAAGCSGQSAKVHDGSSGSDDGSRSGRDGQGSDSLVLEAAGGSGGILGAGGAIPPGELAGTGGDMGLDGGIGVGGAGNAGGSSLVRSLMVAAGRAHTCALVLGGTVMCWGSDDLDQLGDNTGYPRPTRVTPTLVPGLSGVTAISSGADYTCALLEDRTVKCWGRFSSVWSPQEGTPPVVVADLTDVINIAAGPEYMLALRRDGTVWCWGSHDSGALGCGSGQFAEKPTPVANLTGVVSVAAGGRHSCALESQGTVKCWGANEHHELGHGSSIRELSPVAVTDLRDVTAISAGDSHTCALLVDRTVRCWGQRFRGQLGDGNLGSYTNSSEIPVKVSGLANVSSIAAGGENTCAVLADGTARCWGYGALGRLGDGTYDSPVDKATPVPVLGLTDAVTISIGSDHSCATLKGGGIKCWGNNLDGQTGDPATAPRTTPADVKGLTGAVSLSTSGYHTCAVLADSTLSCWGLGPFLRPDLEGFADQLMPTRFPVLTNVTGVAVAQSSTCVLLVDGTAQCWGENYYGGLGAGIADRLSGPVAVAGLANIRSLAKGTHFTCALLADTTVACWGSNQAGQLGLGPTGYFLNQATPIVVPELYNARAVSAGSAHVCASVDKDEFWCWGQGFGGKPVPVGMGGVVSSFSGVLPVSMRRPVAGASNGGAEAGRSKRALGA